MLFKTKHMIIKRIKRITRATFFKDLKIGDEVFFTVNFINTAGSRNGLHALHVECYCENRHIFTTNSQNQFANNIRIFELEEIDDTP